MQILEAFRCFHAKPRNHLYELTLISRDCWGRASRRRRPQNVLKLSGRWRAKKARQ